VAGGADGNEGGSRQTLTPTAIPSPRRDPPRERERGLRSGIGGAGVAGVGLAAGAGGGGAVVGQAEKRFLDALADHGNIRRAAAAAGFSTQALYARRRLHAEFRDQWDAAKECGRERVDSLLIEAAERTLDPDAFEVRDELPKVTIAEAIAILRLHKASEQGKLGGGGNRERGDRRHRVATNEEVTAALTKALKAYRKRQGAKRAAQGWSEHDGHLIPPGWVRVSDESGTCARAEGGEEGEGREP
jgi:hypothetical protein